MLKALFTKIKALFWLCMAGLLTVSLITHNATDQSLDTASNEPVQNALGRVGALVSDFLFQYVGWGAWLFVVLLLTMFWTRWKNIPARKRWLSVVGFIFLLMSFCFLVPPEKGGVMGSLFCQCLWLPNLSRWVYALLWVVWGVAVVFWFKIPFRRVMESLLRVLRLLPKLKKIVPEKLPPLDVKPLKPVLAKVKKKSPPKKAAVAPAPKKKVSGFVLPGVDLLDDAKAQSKEILSRDMMESVSAKLETVLGQFGVKGKIVRVSPGPVVTLYEFEPAPGVKVERVIGLGDNIAVAMKVQAVRMAVVPASGLIGIEVPNKTRQTVFVKELVDSDAFINAKGSLPLILGKNIGGTPFFADLAKMPHLLVAGTTGSGKSVGINTMILSLLYRFTPEECRLIMVDPKMLELSVYNGIPHLLTPVVTEPGKAVVALKWAVREMEDRYRAMSEIGVRNIDGYNKKIRETKEAGKTLTHQVQTGFDPETGRPIVEQKEIDLTPLPYLVIIVDEMADLMLTAGKDVEAAIQRLAQMARAAGLHLIMATQRPSVDVITGTIKANFPTRISFQVVNKFDSRTILGEQGAEQLLGRGDMLYMAAGVRPVRLHGPFVSDGEIERVINYLKEQQPANYVEAVVADEGENAVDEGAVFDRTGMGGEGDLYEKAVAIVVRDNKPSISYVQRQLRIGYNRAADLIDRMEREGIVSKASPTGRREVLTGDKS